MIDNIDNIVSTDSTVHEPEYIDSFGIFTIEQVQKLKEECDIDFNPDKYLRKIYTPLFQKNGIRSLKELRDSTDKKKKDLADDIVGDFMRIQELVITKKKTYTNRKGQIEIDEVPYYDYRTKTGDYNTLKETLLSVVVPPDFDAIKKSMLPEDWNKAKDLIRKITKYYIFKNPEQFVERFALLICNAKSKALGLHPKWGVMFSIFSIAHGMGKGWFRDMVAKTHDEVFQTQSTPCSYSLLLGDFNSVLRTMGFLCIDEKYGINQGERDRLKNIITEKEVMINPKGKDAVAMNNLTTIFSCTNSSIIGVMSLQQNRRIVEFELIGKNGEMPEEELHDLLVELWKVAPCVCPVQNKVIDELVDESTTIQNANIRQIVVDLFTEYGGDILNGVFVKLNALKKYISQLGKIPHDDIIQWCYANDILKQQKNGCVSLSKKALSKLQAELIHLQNKSDGDEEKPFQEDDIMKL